jgi:hypothetical protein
MDDIARAVQSALDHIETDNRKVDGVVRGFIKNVKRFAQKDQKGDTEGMSKVFKTRESIHKRLDILEKTVPSSTMTTQSTDFVTFWRALRMNARQEGNSGVTAPPIDRLNGVFSPGVSEIELDEYHQVFAKIADQGSRERFRRSDVSENNIIQRVDKRIVATTLRTPSFGAGCYACGGR